MAKTRMGGRQAAIVCFVLHLSTLELVSVAVSARGRSQIDVKEIRLSEKDGAAPIIRYQAGQFVLVHYTRQRSVPPESVSVLAVDGIERFRCTPATAIPDATEVTIRDAAANARGVLVVSTFATSAAAER